MRDTVVAPCDVEELLRLKRQFLMPCAHHFYQRPPAIVAGEGCWLIDDAGNRYLDCYSGVTVMSAGHCNSEIIEPVIAQIRTLQHTTSIYLTEPVLRLAEAIARIAPPGLRRSFFCASGSEAVEGALLLASLHTRRAEVIAMSNSLHGRTRWGMSVTGLPMWRADPFPVGGVHHVPFGDLNALHASLKSHADRIAAVVAEPVQGNGGITIPKPDYWPAVRALCDEFGVLLVFDEVQTGFNRTGRWFAAEHWNVAPDVMSISKAMGNGFPIAAFVAREEVAASFTRPSASTYGGNPVSATAALAVIDFHARHDLGARAARMGWRLREALEEISRGSRHLHSPRGLGLMIGVDVLATDGSPEQALCDSYLERLKDLGVLAGKTGPGRNVLTFLPPLTINDDELEVLVHALQEVAA